MSSSGSERSPKRQRLESYSPASPPPAPDNKTLAEGTPHTPPPSVRMSPSWQAQNISSQPGTSGNMAMPTPPSTVGAQSQPLARSMSSEEGNFNDDHSTPMTEADGEARKDSDGDAEMADGVHGKNEDCVRDVERRKTNHERDSYGAVDHLSRLSTNGLYKLSAVPIAPSEPHASQDLLELYDLRRIQTSVARRDPVTGEKINKLRKSYEGKVKLLGLEGRNKAQPNQKDLEGLVDPGWDNRTPDEQSWWEASLQGIELGNPAAEQDVLSKLDVAFGFQPGRLPNREHEQWKNVLGLDEVAPTTAVKGPTTTAAMNPAARIAATAARLGKTGPDAPMRNSAPASPKSGPPRPDRQGKKRRYDESSYSGYHEGFEDDGYSTGGIDDTGRRNAGSIKRQKRKDFPPGAVNSPAFSANAGSGNSLVGIRS